MAHILLLCHFQDFWWFKFSRKAWDLRNVHNSNCISTTPKPEGGNGEITNCSPLHTESGHNSAEAREGGWLRSLPTECHYKTMEEGRRQARKIIPVLDETKLNCKFNTQLSKISDVELDVIYRIWRKVIVVIKQPTIF